jgi:hypothetical protein
MTDFERWADYHYWLGCTDGRAEGYFVGGFWGFVAGFATFFLLRLWS